MQDTWPDLRVEVWYPHARESVAATLDQVSGQPDQLLFAADRKREPRSFTLTLSRPMGQKRGRAEGSFVRETRAQAVTFYRDLVQSLKAWQVRPPQIPSEPDLPATPPASPPDILPLQPKDVVPPGTSNEDMSDFKAPTPPIREETTTVAAEPSNGAATDGTAYRPIERSEE